MRVTTELGDDAGDAGPGWLLLIYRVPPEPTRLRSTVWRRIKSLGAIYLQNSVAALPASPTAERSLRKLRREILDMSRNPVSASWPSARISVSAVRVSRRPVGRG